MNEPSWQPPLPPRPDTPVEVGPSLVPRPAPTEQDVREDTELRRRIGFLMLAGISVNLVSYAIPWLVATGEFGRLAASVLALGGRPWSILIALAAFVFAAGYAGGSRWVWPPLFIILGCLCLIGGVIDYVHLGSVAAAGMRYMGAHAANIGIHPGVGRRIDLAGTGVFLVGGMWATVAWLQGPRITARDAKGSRTAWVVGLVGSALFLAVLIAAATHSPFDVPKA